MSSLAEVQNKKQADALAEMICMVLLLVPAPMWDAATEEVNNCCVATHCAMLDVVSVCILSGINAGARYCIHAYADASAMCTQIHMFVVSTEIHAVACCWQLSMLLSCMLQARLAKYRVCLA